MANKLLPMRLLMFRFYHESDGGGIGGGPGYRCHYVVDRYANPLSNQRRTDVGSRGEARKLAKAWNQNPPWSAWDDIQEARDKQGSSDEQAM